MKPTVRHSARNAWRPVVAAMLAAASLVACDAPPAPASVPSTPVKAVDTPPPAYPMALACDAVGGKVELMITVGAQGTVTRADMQRSSGQAALDAAAMDAVRDWRFRAATYNGQPVETRVAVPITFNVPPEEPAECYHLRNG